MATDSLIRFLRLSEILRSDISFFKSGQVSTIDFETTSIDDIRRWIDQANRRLSKAYQDGYTKPLSANLQEIIDRLTQRSFGQYIQRDYALLTQIVNAGIQPTIEDVAVPLRSIQKLTDEMYDSFLAARKTLRLTTPLDHELPPLISLTDALPSYVSNLPPLPSTLEIEQMADYLPDVAGQFRAGSVALPSGYKDRPLLWGVLGHEVGGHYVLTAEKRDYVLTELQDGLFEEVHKAYSDEKLQVLAPLWRSWAEEAASDVCCVLNLGPSSGFGAMSYYAAILPLSQWPTEMTWVYSEENAHPLSFLIPHLICGAIDGLAGDLSQDRRDSYTRELLEIGQGYQHIYTRVDRDVTFPVGARVWNPRYMEQPPIDLPESLPLKALQDSARLVGRLIATAPLTSLNRSSLKDLTRWGDKDEDIANNIAERLLVNDPPKTMNAKMRHLLAGSINAFVQQPRKDFYQSLNTFLGKEFARR